MQLSNTASSSLSQTRWTIAGAVFQYPLLICDRVLAAARIVTTIHIVKTAGDAIKDVAYAMTSTAQATSDSMNSANEAIQYTSWAFAASTGMRLATSATALLAGMGSPFPGGILRHTVLM